MIPTKLTSIQLKWLAIITMTIDHFGVIVLMPYRQNLTIDLIYILTRLIGRIAFPLFAFMIVEGVLKSKRRHRYLSRLIGMTLTIAIAMAILQALNMSLLAGNIFIDLTFAALTMTAIVQKSTWRKLLAILPLSYYIFSSQSSLLPSYLKPDYGLYGLLIFALFFWALYLYPVIQEHLSSRFSFREDAIGYHRLTRYQIASIAFIFFHIGWYIIYVVSVSTLPTQLPWIQWLNQYAGAQSYALISGVILLLYQGEKGIAPRWFQSFTYLYYPLHFIGLYGIYLLTTLLR